MVLNYFKGANNFGDALNPKIFSKVLPDFFCDNSDTDFYGIGSILEDTNRLGKKERKKVIFSSGYGAYGEIPVIDDKYDIVCVRGPLTARVLNIDPKLAVTDGAILLKLFKFPAYIKKYNYSYMPHHDSLIRFNWKLLCDNMGVHFINPLNDHETVIKEILETKVLFAEALHGAIVADTLRVPWVPVKSYHHVREFKWLDWAASMKVVYKPNMITSVFDDKLFITNHFNKLSKNNLPEVINKLAVNAFIKFQMLGKFSKLEKEFCQLKNAATYLSSADIVTEKVDILLEKIDYVKMKYSNQ